MVGVVIIDGDGVDEQVNEHVLLGFEGDRLTADAFKEVYNGLFRQRDHAVLGFLQLGLQAFLPGFQLGYSGDQSIGGGVGHLDCLCQIPDLPFNVRDLLLIHGDIGVLLDLVFGLAGGGGSHIVDNLIRQSVQRVPGDHVFQPVLRHGSLVAAVALLAAGAGIVAVLSTGFSGAGVSNHGAAALTAEYFAGQEVGNLCFSPGRRCGVGAEAALDGLPHVVRDNAGDGICLPDVGVLVHADIFLVPENILEG